MQSNPVEVCKSSHPCDPLDYTCASHGWPSGPHVVDGGHYVLAEEVRWDDVIVIT